MTPCTGLILLICVVQYTVTDARLDGLEDGPVNIGDVRLDGQEGKQFGLLMVEVDNNWTPICDDKFTQNTAVVACRQLNFKDGRYLRGGEFESTSSDISPVELDCTGTESHLNECLALVHHNCSSKTFSTLYCSTKSIKVKAAFDIRINNEDDNGLNNNNNVYGAIEVNKYGFWGPVCYKNWSNFEANTACKHLGYRGGVVHYATLSNFEPMILGQFKCRQRDTMLYDCDYEGFGHDNGCGLTTSDNTEQQVAGVLCYQDEEGIQFKLSNQWYGEVQVLYNGSWGSVCSDNWSEDNSKTICNQLGYKNGQTKYDIYTAKRPAYMDNVNCMGNEDSILLCDYTPGWIYPTRECSSAYVSCEKTVCGSIDIRKKDDMHYMKYCNIVEGNLTIMFIETVSAEDYRYYTNPGLIEITDYLLLYRVYQLRSIEILFPNLAIIRGDNLFTDSYALYIFEMPDLVDLGLKSLATISRGAVRLEKNPSLCYIETIDWDAIMVDSTENYFKDNKLESECWNKCSFNCVKTLSVNKYLLRCWNENSCQQITSCPDRCHTGICNRDICCHDNCLAGCTGSTLQQCTACRYVSYQDNSGMISCTQLCPSGTYMYRNRRCLLEAECIAVANNSRNYRQNRNNKQLEVLKPVTITDENNVKKGLCVSQCPDGYQTDPNDSYACVPCAGKCPKVKKGLELHTIDSIHAAEVLKGYNIIEGNLEFKLMYGDKISKILEENLADLEEVTGYVKIQYSFAILSLHFLKNLRKIGGENLYNGYVLYVYNNENLQELFLEEVTKRLYLGPGKVFFQSNRKLCYNKISQFLTTVGRNMNSISGKDISNETNGDMIPCEIQNLTLSLIGLKSDLVMIEWTLMDNIVDPRRLLNYIIYWRETSGEPLSTFEGRDACSEDVWFQKHTPPNHNLPSAKAIVGGLKPWTNYAMYVKAATVYTSVQGAMSNILYFRTNADSPSSPVKLQIQSDKQEELHVIWDAPLKLNGEETTVYVVQWQYKLLDTDIIDTRDYCLNPITSSLFRQPTVTDKTKENNSTEEEEEKKCCCQEAGNKFLHEENQRLHSIDFHDYLQNILYARTSSTVSVKTALDVVPVNQALNLTSTKTQDENKTSNLPDTSAEESSKVHQNTVSVGISSHAAEKSGNEFDLVTEREWTIKNLGYFTHINVKVKACNRDSENASLLLCSPEAFIFGRTLPNELADSVNASLVSWELATNQTGAVYVKWKEPTHPNGLVLAYDVQVQNPNIVAKPMLICITAKVYRQKGKLLLERLSSGNYTLKIRAISLAGNGSWSEEIFFQIPDQLEVTKNINTLVIVLTIVVVIIIMVATMGIWCFYKRRKSRQDLMYSTNPDYMQSYYVYTPDEWEIERDKVFIVKELGHGSFGMVYEGYLWDNLDKKSEGKKIPVAIKTTNANSSELDRYQFLQEASIMKKFCCHHVVRLIGVASKEEPAYVLMELMSNGDLKSYLRLHRPDNEDNNGRPPPTLKQFLQMAGEIADGMAYLADNKFVHRDLAARNCMVGEDLTVKIGDFGMTRDIYETDYYRKGSRGLLPVRWMPPESLRDGVFTSMTDVWSYGVVLWEMATLAEQPYQGLSNEEVMTYVLSGRIIDSPEGCPIRLYDLMVKCWRFRPKQRPTFKEIIELLLPDLNKKFEEVSYFFSEENARHMEAVNSNILENPIPNMIDDFDDDGYFDSPVNDYMEEVLPMLCDEEINGAVDSGVISQTNGLNQTHNREEDVFHPDIMFSQTDFDNNDCVQSSLDKSLNNEVKYPYNDCDDNSLHGNLETVDNYLPSLKETHLANGHVPSDVRTTVC